MVIFGRQWHNRGQGRCRPADRVSDWATGAMTSKDFPHYIFHPDLNNSAVTLCLFTWGTVVFWQYYTRVCLVKHVLCLTVSGHANREAFLETTVLAPIAVHAHDQTVLVLHTHLVVDVLLDAAAEKSLKKQKQNSIYMCL